VAYLNSSLADVIRNWTAAGGLFVQAGRDAQVVSFLFGLPYLPASAASLLPAQPTANILTTPYAASSDADLSPLSPLTTAWELVGVPDEHCLYSTDSNGDGGLNATEDGACSVVRQSYGAGRVMYLAWDFADAAPDGGAQDGGAWVDLLHTAVLSDAPSLSLSPRTPVLNDTLANDGNTTEDASPSPSPSLSPSPSPSVWGSPSPSASPIVGATITPTANVTQTTMSASPSPSPSPTFYPAPSLTPSASPSPSVGWSPSPSPSVGSSHSPSPSSSPGHDEDDDGAPAFEIDLLWVLAVVILAIVVLVVVAVAVKLIERFGRRRDYTEIPAGSYDEDEYHAHGRV
jgi:hypothetical protein